MGFLNIIMSLSGGGHGHGHGGNSDYDAHGWLMAIAFAVLFPIGVIISALGKLVDLPNWWIIHGCVQSVAAFLAIAGCVVAIDATSDHFHNWHATLGLTIIILVLLQVAAGTFRPGALWGSKDGKAHAVFVVVHRAFGVVIIILAWVNSWKGMDLHSVETVNKVLYIVCIALMAIAYVSILVVKATKQSAGENEGESSGQIQPGDEPEKKDVNTEMDPTFIEVPQIGAIGPPPTTSEPGRVAQDLN